MFPGQFATHCHPDLVNITVGDVAVGPGEIDVLENAESALALFGKSLETARAVLVNHDDFPRLDIANVLGRNQVERARFAGQDISAVDFSKAKRTKTKGVPHADQF